MSGADVSSLQEILFKDGDYPQDIISGYYGSLTEQAVEAFQAKYGIISYGTPDTTGYGVVGPKTRVKLDGL
jgi:peptidoglycan hydrolase-like protein with peptidoglycan-binding domain